ncbi:Uma2 family endonuclease [Cryptosporangium aurantiacum]|uniref:Endonuclease, Uma2 family (Restriction endonuclease fold) n=1 Tax=Cryptosporangium aurantiacum TaxID=134849 RepID=A0A1M7RHP9_9ACTN|nr:Uma2 family endonuclease [Cryptosporangium aurantiacum]SHN45679.1 Endonuclease, Uma2 family (restriction endonuclease fold) [Cryptosporangium aurantiacum]
MIALPYDWHQPPSGVWTLRDVERLPEGSRVEVIDGALTVNPSPLPIHQRISRRLANAIERQLPPRWQVEIEIDVLLNLEPLDYVAPDVVVFGADVPLTTRPIPAEQFALVVEVVSPGSRRRDRGSKPLIYAHAGVPYYWRIEGEPVGAKGPTVHVFSEPGDDGYRDEQAYTGRLRTRSPFPIELDLDELERSKDKRS